LRRLPIVPAVDLHNFSVGANERRHQRVHDLATLSPVLQAKEFGNYANLLRCARGKLPLLEGMKVTRALRASPS
jgi:hypothetical protein